MSHEKTWRKLKCILQVKEANLKGLHTVWFQQIEIIEKANCGDQKRLVVNRG